MNMGFFPADLDKMKDIAKQKIKEWKELGMSDNGILNLANGLMLNKINNDNMLLCLEIKRQINENICSNK